MVFAEENSWPNMLLLAQIQLSSQKHDSERKSRPDKGTVNMAERVGRGTRKEVLLFSGLA